MASPHVAGIAALYLASNPNATPAQVKAALVAGSLSGRVSSPGSGSPNLLANIGFLSASNPPVPPVDPPPAADDLLRNNVARIRLNAVKGNEQFFRVEVPAGKSTLTVQISGGSGDADLYVKAGAKPTTGSYDCRPYINGNGETCRISVKPGAVYHVMLRAYSAYSNVSLRASF